MQLSVFETLVEDALPAGAAYTANISNFVEMAARWLERNYTFVYMTKYAAGTLGALNPALDLSTSNLKRIIFIRWVLADGEYSYLHQANPEDLKVLETGIPTHYYFLDNDSLILTQIPAELYDYELSYVEYTDWSALGPTDEPWLLLHAIDVMLGQTMMMMSSFTRDKDAKVFWQDFRDDALKNLQDAELELMSSTESLVMNYGNETQVGNR